MSAARGRRLARRTATSVVLFTGVLAAPILLGPLVGPLAGVSVTAAPRVQPEAQAAPPALPAPPPRPAPDRSPGPPPRGMSVEGNRLLKDGEPFLPRGFNMIGLLTPDWCDRKTGIEARVHFGRAELDAARGWGADTLRFQVSQRGLADPTVPQAARDAYLARVTAGVGLARQMGFVVIVSMQDQAFGCGRIHPLPSGETVAAWDVLVPRLAGDPYVMFELFNEPRNENDAAGWAQWRDGGRTPYGNHGDRAVGHQALVEHLRSRGTTNVLIADTARLGGRSTGLPWLADPTGNLAYAIHPYSFDLGHWWWDRQYGALADVAPVIATEWNYLAGHCGTAREHLAPRLLEYLAAHRIGVLGHAFDDPGTTVADWAWTPTACGTGVGGSGQTLRNWFAAHRPAG